MRKSEQLKLAEWVINRARRSGADQAAASISHSRQVDIEFRDSKLEKVKESTRKNLSLDLYIQQKYSSHSTSDLKKASLGRFIEEAISSTRYLTRDEYRSLPDPKYYPDKPPKDLKVNDPDYSKVESSDRVAMAAEIEAAAMAQSDQIISTTSGYFDVYTSLVRVHSNGFAGEIQGTRFSAGAEVTARDGEKGRTEDWFYASTRHRSDLPSAKILGERAVERALRKIGQQKIMSGKYDMIVENRAGSRLLSMLQQPMTAYALQQKQSFLEGMLDKKIASEKFTVIDDPFLEKGLGSRYFDGEGLAAKKRTLIEKGVLRQYLVDNYYGRKLGMEPNSGSVANLVFEYGSESLDELLKHLDKGILVTGFIGGNSNSTTGDFSFGIVGQLIEKGEVVQPVNEMNISGNAKEFWNRLAAMGNDPYPYSSLRMPSMLFEDVDFSGL
ncbi:MAG: TldD/PmbA family protein [Calditrichaeota bacterium]|nr:TldD/PmbA family protein [Calditrichota bacterium]